MLKINNEKFIEISVKDTGIGIKKENINKLFKMFSMLEDSQKENQSGTGLGLFISKKFSEKLTFKGDKGLKVESDYGSGLALFWKINQLVKNN